MPKPTRQRTKVCATPGCPELTTSRYCHQHGLTTTRGYGTPHQHERRAWHAHVQAGNVLCARCHQPIHPNQPWDLDHTPDRTTYLGPSHTTCNRSRKEDPNHTWGTTTTP